MSTKYQLNRHYPTASSFSGEDGDFVQLRIERYRRSHQRLAEKRASDAAGISKPDKRRINNAAQNPIRPDEQNTEESKSPKTNNGGFTLRAQEKRVTSDKEDKESLQKKLFKAIDENNAEKFNQKRTKHARGVGLETFTDPRTGMSVLLYALEKNCMMIAVPIIQEGDVNLLRSRYLLQQFGVTGYRNALHILIQQGDKEVFKYVLDKVADKEVEMEMLTTETLIQTEDPRPKLLPCLHLAAYFGQPGVIKIIIERTGMDVNICNSRNETALMWASRRGHTETVKMLIANGAKTNLEDETGTTSFYLAVRYSQVEVAKILITEGKADPNKSRRLGLVSPLITASAYGNTEMVELILNQPGVDVNLRIRGGETALHHATREGYTDIVRLLLSFGAMPDTPDEMGDTPLLLAAKHGHVDIADILINNGAKLDQRNHEGRDRDIWQFAIDCDGTDLLETVVIATADIPDSGRQPLCIAASMGKIDKIDFLIKIGLDVSATDKDGNSFLHFAAMNDQRDVLKKFYSQELLDLQNKKGNTAFHIACYRGYENTISTLIDLKARPGIRNNKGETVLHSAAYSNSISAETINMIIEYTVAEHSWDTINLTDYQGSNCLHIAAKHADTDVIWEFRPVSIKDQDKDGMTPLHNAVRPGKPEILDIMLDIFEMSGRDARINEQTFASRETVLQLAVKECHVEEIGRLIQLGADLSERDITGNTVLHRIVMSCVQDSQRKLQYLEVFDRILENIVVWWCMKSNKSIPYESDMETIMKYREEAILFICHTVLNNEGMSVCDLAFAVGCSDVLSKILMMEEVTHFVTDNDDARSHVFDISGLMPRTKRALILTEKAATNKDEQKHSTFSRSFSKTRTLLKDKSKGLTDDINDELPLLPEHKDTKIKKLSGMDWLMTCPESIKTGEILDLPPVQIIERHFSSIVAWTFSILLILHVVYMSIFTYVGIEVQTAIRKQNFSMTLSDLKKANTGVLYFIVPSEPLVIFIFFIYLCIRYCITGDIKRRIQLSKTHSVWTAISVMQEYALPLIYFSFAVLVFLWIILLRAGYKYQDYILSVAICFGWLLSITFTRGIKMVHYFYKMLLNIIIRDVFRFLLVYMFVLLAISLAIHVLFQQSDDITNVYKTPGSTVFLTFNLMMGMGELFDDTLDEGLESADRTSDFVKIFYLLYIVLGSMVMLNVLIAMMNDSYSRVLREGSTDWRIDSIRIGMEIERSLSASRIFSSVKTTYGQLGSHSAKRWSVSISDTEMQDYFQALERRAYQPDALTKRMDILEQRTVAMEKLMVHNFQQISEALQTNSKKKKGLKKKMTLFGKGQDAQTGNMTDQK